MMSYDSANPCQFLLDWKSIMRINKIKFIALVFIVCVGISSINSHSADKKKVNVNMSKYVYPPHVDSQYFPDLNDVDWIIKSFWDGALLSVAAPAAIEAYRYLFLNKLTRPHQLGAGSALAMLSVLSGALNARYQLLYGWNKKKGNANFNQGGWQKVDKGDGLIRYIIDDDNREVSKIAHIELRVNRSPGSCPLSEPVQLDDESMGAWLKCYLERREKPYLVIEKSSAQKKADPESSVDSFERTPGELVGRKNVCLASRKKHCFTSRLLDLVNSIAADEQIYLFFDKEDHKPIKLKVAIVREHNKEQHGPENDQKKGKPDQITLSSSPLLTITREEWGDSIVFEDFILNRMPVFKEENKIWSCDIGDKSNYMGSYGDKLFPDCFAGMWDRKLVHGKNEKPRLVSAVNHLGFVTEMIAIFKKTGQVEHDFSRQYSLDEGAYNHKGNTVFPIPLEHVRVFNGQYVNLFDVGGLHCYQVPGLTGVPLRCVLGSQERQVFFNDHDEDEKNKAKMHDFLDLNTAWDGFYKERSEIRTYRKEHKSSDPVLGSAFYASKLSLWSVNNIVLPGYQLLRGIKNFENSYVQPIREAEKYYLVDPARAVVKAVVEGALNGAIDGVVKGTRAVASLPFFALWGGGVLLK